MQPRFLPLVLALQLMAGQPLAGQVPLRCPIPMADTIGWGIHPVPGHHIVLALPATFAPDTSVLAALATYHGGKQLTDGHRVVYYSGYAKNDLRLQGMWPHEPRQQSPGWPRLAPHWTTTVLTDTTDGSQHLTAWFVGPRPADRIQVSVSAPLTSAPGLSEAILCTVRLVRD